MNFKPLNEKTKADLEKRHRRERDGRVRDRIKAVLLKDEGWTHRQIAQALRIHEETIRQHMTDWLEEEKLKPENGGSHQKLSEEQSRSLERHLELTTYTEVKCICAYVLKHYGVSYTVSGMTKWLHAHGFSYKQPKGFPKKADAAKQEAFIERYLELLEAVLPGDPIIFMDSAHPTMATKIAHGWIRKGQDKLIPQTASRTRVNVMGGVELSTMKVTTWYPEKVNTESTIAFFDQLKAAYPQASTLHLILDQAGYHRSEATQCAAKEKGIELHFLPPYSPNLNPIERLWKVMNEECRNNVFFSSAKKFRETISNFFDKEMPTIRDQLRARINDDFQIINPVPSG